MSKIAVFFPGIGYHCDKPLLYYSYRMVEECGDYESIRLSYSYDGGNIRGDEAKMQAAFDALYAQTEEQLAKVRFCDYEEVVFLSKSVGTIIAAAYAERHGISCRKVLYTPLRHTYAFHPGDAVAFIGTKDPWSDVGQVMEASRKAGVPIYSYENANHSLEVGNALEDIKILRDVMEKTHDYLKKMPL
jgi:phosphoglycolate phosphatase